MTDLAPSTPLPGNRSAVLREAMLAPSSLSVAELATSADLSRPTVTASLGWLIDHGYVEPAATEAGQRTGRPARRYRFSAHGFVVVTVVLRRRSIGVQVVDLGGEVLSDADLTGQPIDQLTDPIEQVGALIAEALGAEPVGGKRPTAIVVSVLGVVEEQRRIRTSGALTHLVGSELHRRMSERFGCRVVVENDANLAALAEARSERAVDTLVGVLIGPDLGAGIVIDGALYRGSRGAAGELRTAWSTAWIDLQQSADRVAGGATTRLFEMAGAQDPAASRQVQRFAEQVGTGLVMLIEVLDPALVVIGGEATLAGDVLLQPLRQIVHDRTRSQVEVIASALGPDTLHAGAVMMAHDVAREVLLKG